MEVEVPASGVDEAQTRHLTHGYYAVTSYMDAQLGLILDALEKTGHADLFAWQFFYASKKMEGGMKERPCFP